MVEKNRSHEKKEIFILKNWWIQHEERNGKTGWLARGNCYNNPKFMTAEGITTSWVQHIELHDEEFWVYTMNSIYACRINKYLGDGSGNGEFDWLNGVSVGIVKLTDVEQNDLKNRMTSSLKARRAQAEQQLMSEILDEGRYMYFILSDENEFLLDDFKFGPENQADMVKQRVVKDGDIKVLALTIYHNKPTEWQDEVYIAHDMVEIGTAEFHTSAIFFNDIYISNCGHKDLYIHTVYGWYQIKADKLIYRIGADAFAGRVAKS